MIKKSMAEFYFWLVLGFGFWVPLVYFFEWIPVEEGTSGSAVLNSLGSETPTPTPKPEYRETFETAESCLPSRKYHLDAIELLKQTLAAPKTPADEISGAPTRQCVTYIMEKMGHDLVNRNFALCSTENSEPMRGLSTQPSLSPCRTEEYVQLTYNSLTDVMDCLEIPIRELLPKLYNESGLHFNTLGPGMDAGVGQLTRQALLETFDFYDGEPKNPTVLDYYLKEVKQSTKASCQRIAKNEDLIRPQVPAGLKLCNVTEAEVDQQLPVAEQVCYLPWASKNRCSVVVIPQNPLRNIFYTGLFYRSMVRYATGLSLEKGAIETISKDGMKQPYVKGMNLKGYLENYHIKDRMAALGITDFSQEAVKSMFVSFGFNAGIDKGAVLFDVYLKGHEAAGLKLKADDFDFRNIQRNFRWGSLVSLQTLFKALTSTADDERKFLKIAETLKESGLNNENFLKKYYELKALVKADAKASQDLTVFATQYSVQRNAILQTVLDQAYQLSLPEFMVIAHGSYTNHKGQNLGGAPGYLNFIMRMQVELDQVFGEGICTSPDYLKFL